MSDPLQLVVFVIEEQRYALHLAAVERIVRVVEPTALRTGPDIILGVINVRGKIVPVVNLRRRFRIPERELSLNDQIVVARTPRRTVALIVDAIVDVVECSDQLTTRSEDIVPGMDYIEGVMKLEDGLILIHDLDTFLSLEEEQALDDAFATSERGKP